MGPSKIVGLDGVPVVDRSPAVSMRIPEGFIKPGEKLVYVTDFYFANAIYRVYPAEGVQMALVENSETPGIPGPPCIMAGYGVLISEGEERFTDLHKVRDFRVYGAPFVTHAVPVPAWWDRRDKIS